MAKAKGKALPDLQEEALLWKQGSAFVFGVDEAGRGCLAGPVSAAVACWAPHSSAPDLVVPVRDSKLMTEAQREAAFDPVRNLALATGMGFATAAEIDRWNILRATFLAVARALEISLASLEARGIFVNPSEVAFLSDGHQSLANKARFFAEHPDFSQELPLLRALFRHSIPEKCVVKGDSKVFSIASASVLAKVNRDRHMSGLDAQFPQYEFALHKGYGTPLHLRKLKESGPCFEHRRTFAPVANTLTLFPQA